MVLEVVVVVLGGRYGNVVRKVNITAYLSIVFYSYNLPHNGYQDIKDQQ